jgi:hypothetical protein
MTGSIAKAQEITQMMNANVTHDLPSRLVEKIPRLAQQCVEQIQSTPFIFQPKRGEISPTARGWRERFQGYRWPARIGLEENWTRISAISDALSAYSQKLHCGTPLSAADRESAVQSCIDLFAWGGVLSRGRGHNPPGIQDINATIRTALTYSDDFNAPMDSAWTKLAAVSSAWRHGNAICPPQVIYDSRVSIALIEHICHCPLAVDASVIDDLRRAGLGYIPGRGGNRPARIAALAAAGWSSAYQKWNAQFLASRIVHEMVLCLDAQGCKMPAPSGETCWTTRGVEMVLFMDGY